MRNGVFWIRTRDTGISTVRDIDGDRNSMSKDQEAGEHLASV